MENEGRRSGKTKAKQRKNGKLGKRKWENESKSM
jgi:hypothetical protein